jgi:hypothetical protein
VSELRSDQMSPLLQREGEIQAQRIKEALDSGENIDLYRVRVLGDLSLSDLGRSFNEPTHINSRIRFSHCFFEGSVKFAKTVFIQEVSFEGSHFESDAVFWPGQTEFQKEADFSFCNFNGKADFSYVKFKGDAVFNQAVFRNDGHSQAEFSHTKFDKDAEFIGTFFGRKAIFLGSRFRDKTDFSSNTIFYDDVQFDDVRFYETPWFYACKFRGNAKFQYVTFYRDAIFSHSAFDKDFSLNGSQSGIIYLEGFEKKILIEKRIASWNSRHYRNKHTDR